MVTTSMTSPMAMSPTLIARDDAPVDHRGFTEVHPPATAQVCTILTPSGALLARALVKPRPASLPENTYAVEVSHVEPSGALEPLLRSNPQVVLRTPNAAQIALRIDHIIGPRERRTYFLQTLESVSA